MKRYNKNRHIFLSKKKTVLLLSVFLISNLYSQNNINISGFVNDKTTGESLIGANVLLYKDTLSFDMPPLSGAATNSYGFYAIPGVTEGNYILVFKSLGYKTLLKNLNVTSTDENLKLNVNLLSENIKLDEVVVTAKKDENLSISTINISPELLKKLPSLSGETNIFKSLQMLPGVQAESELSKGLYVRGGSPDQTLTLVDGMTVYNPSHLGNFTTTFNSDAVQDIKLIKGAFPAEYGGRLSSVLDIKLRSGTKEKNKGSLSLGFINSGLNLEGPLSENSTYMMSGRGMYYDAVQRNFRKNSIAPRYNYFDLNTKLTYTISDQNIISISGFYSKDHLYNPSGKNDILYNINWQNGALNLNWLQAGAKSFFTNTTLCYINYSFESIYNSGLSTVSSSDYFASSNLTDFILKKNFEIYWNENIKLKTGAEITLHKYDLLLSNFYDPALETSSVRTSLFAPVFSFYLQGESQISAKLKTNLGGRFYFFDKSKYSTIEPRFSISFAFTDNFFINAAAATAHQFLHLITRDDISLPTDLWYPSSEKIKPGKSTEYVFGLDKYFLNREYLFSVETYYRDMKNLYEFKSDAKYDISESIENLFTEGEGEAYGVEVFLNKTEGSLTGWIGYTLSWTKRLFKELNGGKVFYPRYDRRNDLSLALAYDFNESLSAGLIFVYATGQGFTLPAGQYKFDNILGNGSQIFINYPERNGFKLPAYHKLDLNITYKFIWLDLPFQAYLNFYNIYNRQNAFAEYITKDDNENLKLKQITLFPFIPSAGIKFEF